MGPKSMHSLSQANFKLFGESPIYLKKNKLMLLHDQQRRSVWSVPVATGKTYGNTFTAATFPFKKRKK